MNDPHMSSSLPSDRHRTAREIAVVFGVVTTLVFAATRFRDTPMSEFVSLVVGALFLFSALHLAGRERGGLVRFGIDLGGVVSPDVPLLGAVRKGWRRGIREVFVALAVAMVVFPPFALAFRFWNEPTRPFTWTWPDDALSFLLGQLLVIALPEEAFFRGYAQTRLTDLMTTDRNAPPLSPRGRRGEGLRRILLAEVSPSALVGQSALFALVHFVVDLNPARLAVFFPGLLFGWLRAWRGGVGAAIVFHALCNLYQAVLVGSWL